MCQSLSDSLDDTECQVLQGILAKLWKQLKGN